VGLAAAALGTIAASAGLPVAPGPTPGAEATWKSPVAMLVGPSSVRATMVPDGSFVGVPGTTPAPSVRRCFARDRCDAVTCLTPSLAPSRALRASSAFATRARYLSLSLPLVLILVGALRGWQFPHELQVAQLLQENLLCVDAIKANLLSARLSDNVKLMAAFRDNAAAVLCLLSALPVVLPPLPSSARLNESFLPPQAVSGGGAAGTAHGVDAGVAFAHHPSDLLGSRAAKRARGDDRFAAGTDTAAPLRPPQLNLAATSRGLSLVPGASPANALQALPLGRPSAPVL